MPTYEYNCTKCGVIEIFHGILEDPKNVCTECGQEGLIRLISSGGAVIMKGREANQYNDVKYAKYWRDKNGIRHKVGYGDGHTGSITVNKQTVSDEVVSERKKRGRATYKKKRTKDSYAKFKSNVARNRNRGNRGK